VPRAKPFGLKPGVINAVRASQLGDLFLPGSLVNQNAGAGTNWAKGLYATTHRLGTFFSLSLL